MHNFFKLYHFLQLTVTYEYSYNNLVSLIIRGWKIVCCFNLNISMTSKGRDFSACRYSVSCLFLALAFCVPRPVKEENTKVLRWCKLQHQNDFKLMVKPIICVRSRTWSQLSQLVIFMKLQIVIMRSNYVHRVMPIYVWHV